MRVAPELLCMTPGSLDFLGEYMFNTSQHCGKYPLPSRVLVRKLVKS